MVIQMREDSLTQRIPYKVKKAILLLSLSQRLKCFISHGNEERCTKGRQRMNLLECNRVQSKGLKVRQIAVR